MMWHRATILSRRQLSPSVTGLTLQVDDDSKLSFLPGQWLDFSPAPSSSWNPSDCGKNVGGYSITSIPKSLPRIELAVQSSRHPVAKWVTSSCEAGDVVDVRVGGTFCYKNESNNQQNRRLFIAGGVGINPLFSMIQQWHIDGRENNNSRAMLLYSGSDTEELLFLNELNKLIECAPDLFHVICTVTKQQCMNNGSRENTTDGTGLNRVVFQEGRIDQPLIRDAISWLNVQHNADNAMAIPGVNTENMIADAVYVCGPPGMPESMIKILSEDKLVKSTDSIHFEKWW